MPAEVISLVRAAAGAASARGQWLYIVGGAVRDLLLGRPIVDLDLVVEGNAIALARHLAGARGETVVAHRRFGTATFRLGDFSIDVVTARSETYSRPGALPTVRPGTIGDDLLRRDFTVNAMAIPLGAGSPGDILDPHGGRDDLARGLIRVLHQGSFIDDATRIMRALRYEGRLGFQVEEETYSLMRDNVAMLGTISGDRVRRELELILGEDAPEHILRRAGEVGVLAQLHPALKGDGGIERRFSQARRRGSAEPALYLCLLAYDLTEEEGERLISRLDVRGPLKRDIQDTLRLKGELPALDRPHLPSAVYGALRRRSPRAVLACALSTGGEAARGHLERYLGQYRYVETCLDGDDLQAMGVAPGPGLGRMLKALHDARLDGAVSTREDEEALVLAWMARR